MIRNSSALLPAILPAALLLAVVGCGGGGSNSSSTTSSNPAFTIHERIMADLDGASVWKTAGVDEEFTQMGGVFGTVIAGPTGQWWEIQWDAEPPDLSNAGGWSETSSLAVAPTAGDTAEPDLGSSYYSSSSNIFWAAGYAPASTNPPTPQLGSALGNCTWYAWGRMLELGATPSQIGGLYGNAGQWAAEAEASGLTVNATPAAHAIAELDANTSYPDGHVAVVESVNADGTITVTESSYDPYPTDVWDFLWRHRTVEPTWFSHYIHVL